MYGVSLSERTLKMQRGFHIMQLLQVVKDQRDQMAMACSGVSAAGDYCRARERFRDWRPRPDKHGLCHAHFHLLSLDLSVRASNDFWAWFCPGNKAYVINFEAAVQLRFVRQSNARELDSTTTAAATSAKRRESSNPLGRRTSDR